MESTGKDIFQASVLIETFHEWVILLDEMRNVIVFVRMKNGNAFYNQVIVFLKLNFLRVVNEHYQRMTVFYIYEGEM